MLNKIRRNSKQLLETRRNSVTTVSSIPEITPTTTKERKLNFWDLPAEIRNVIYEHVAIGTSIAVPLPSKKTAKLPLPVPSLLVVSWQTRREYLPLLLELASIKLVVKDFDFRNVRRITSSLYRSELKALRNNTRLTVQLLAEKCTKDSMISLRRWLENRSKGLDRLPLHYSIYWKPNYQIIPTSNQVQVVNTYIMRRKVLNQNLEAMAQLHVNVGENIQFELQPIIAAFETELANTASQPDSPWREESQAMMYGFFASAPSGRR